MTGEPEAPCPPRDEEDDDDEDDDDKEEEVEEEEVFHLPCVPASPSICTELAGPALANEAVGEVIDDDDDDDASVDVGFFCACFIGSLSIACALG